MSRSRRSLLLRNDCDSSSCGESECDCPAYDAGGCDLAGWGHTEPMPKDAGTPPSHPAEMDVRRDGQWAVGTALSEPFAVSRRCRHQLADLSRGSVDATGCLVCPWHQSRYDVTTGAMVTGPRGFLGYHGPVPGYTRAVLALGRVARLRVGHAVRTATGIAVRPS